MPSSDDVFVSVNGPPTTQASHVRAAAHLNFKNLQYPNLPSKPDIWMQISIPNEFQPVGKYNIGVTAGIESSLCRAEWVEGLNRMNTNWVSSNFSKQTFENSKYERRNKQTNAAHGERTLATNG